MSEKGWTIRVRHMLAVIGELEEFTTGITFDVFIISPQIYRGAERILEIIGEASKHIPDAIKNEFPYPWAAVRNMRNVVIHEYQNVNYKVLWDTIQLDIPALKRILQEIEKKYGES